MMKRSILLAFLVVFLSASCLPESLRRDNSSLSLASFVENGVAVSIQLNHDGDGGAILAATFTPPKGFHLYSKDIPFDGLDGLGRPTVLELLSESQMKVVGPLSESAKAEVPDFEPRELLVYPAGPITLSLNVELPAGKNWFDDSLSVTYMACSETLCSPPVEGKVVSVRIPGADIFKDQ